MQQVDLRTDDLQWRGVADLVWDDDRCTPIRVANKNREVLAEALVETAWLASGIRLGFRSNSSTIELACDVIPVGDDPPVFVLAIDGHDVASRQPTGGIVRFTDLPEKQGEVEIWFPHQARCTVTSISVDDDASVRLSDVNSPKWVAYGSSITQSRFASSPTTVWVNSVARQLNLDIQNRGYAGQCLLDPLIATEIASSPFDILSVCTGINVHNHAAMNERVYRSLLDGFLSTVRAEHDEPIVVISPIASPSREHTPSCPRIVPPMLRRWLRSSPLGAREGLLGPTLDELRQATHDVVDARRRRGDSQTHLIDGLTLLSVKEAHLLNDGLHPGPAGEQHLSKSLLGAFSPFVP